MPSLEPFDKCPQAVFDRSIQRKSGYAPEFCRRQRPSEHRPAASAAIRVGALPKTRFQHTNNDLDELTVAYL